MPNDMIKIAKNESLDETNYKLDELFSKFYSWSTAATSDFTTVYGSPTVADGTATVTGKQCVLLPADVMSVRAKAGDKAGSYKMLGLILGINPELELSDEKSIIGAFTFFDTAAVPYLHLKRSDSIHFADATASEYAYCPGGEWANKKNPIVNVLGSATSVAPFEIEKIGKYKIRVTNLQTKDIRVIDVSSWPFFVNGGELRFGFAGHESGWGMTVENIELYRPNN